LAPLPWPSCLKTKERRVEANSLRRKIGAQCFPWGICKFHEANEPTVPQPTWFALNNGGTMFIPKHLSPFAPGEHVSLGDLGPFVQGNHVSFGEIYNCFSRTIIFPSSMKTIHDEDFHCKKCEPQTSHSKVETVNHLHHTVTKRKKGE
jgi:hypothetical protein